MKPKSLYIILLVLLFSSDPGIALGQYSPRITESLNAGWKFFLGDAPDAAEPGFDDRSWRVLDLPHDWSIEGTVSQDAPTGGSGGYLPAGIGWYRKHFTARKSDLKMNNLILFDGVYMNSDVWLNGKHLGNYPFGYNSFYYDLGPYLKAGENVIAVKVDNSKQPNSRWYSGSGIYRHVWLVRTNPLNISQWGVYVTTPEITQTEAIISVNTRLENESSSGAEVLLL